jgi:PleD family two-component response regulator
VTVQDNTVDDHVRSSLMNAVLAKITGQLRKDRHVLRTDDHHFVWFSPDIHSDDGLMPVGRIRQIIDKTRFLHQGTPLAIETHAVVMAVTPHDKAADLILRVQTSLKYAQEHGGRSMCVDLGEGPTFVQPLRLDIDASECVLA